VFVRAIDERLRPLAPTASPIAALFGYAGLVILMLDFASFVALEQGILGGNPHDTVVGLLPGWSVLTDTTGVVGGLLTLAGVVLIVMARVELPGEPRPWRGVVEALLAAVAWGVSVVALRVPLDEIDPVSAQAVRLPVGALLLWVTPWALRGLPGLLRGGWPLFGRLLALAALTAVSSVMYGASVKYAGVAVAAVLSSTAPLFAVPLGIVFLGERLPLLAMIGAAVTVAGIVVLRL